MVQWFCYGSITDETFPIKFKMRLNEDEVEVMEGLLSSSDWAASWKPLLYNNLRHHALQLTTI